MMIINKRKKKSLRFALFPGWAARLRLWWVLIAYKPTCIFYAQYLPGTFVGFSLD